MLFISLVCVMQSETSVSSPARDTKHWFGKIVQLCELSPWSQRRQWLYKKNNARRDLLPDILGAYYWFNVSMNHWNAKLKKWYWCCFGAFVIHLDNSLQTVFMEIITLLCSPDEIRRNMPDNNSYNVLIMSVLFKIISLLAFFLHICVKMNTLWT